MFAVFTPQSQIVHILSVLASIHWCLLALEENYKSLSLFQVYVK